MISCMGGRCLSRDKCMMYHAEFRESPAERICGKIERPMKVGTKVTPWSAILGQLVNTSSTGQQDMGSLKTEG
jgi:hypothetical protein